VSHELTRLDKKAGTIEILVSLYTGGDRRMTELARSIHLDRGTIARAVSVLEQLHLVTLDDPRRFPFAREVRLTPLGRQLVRAPVLEWPSILFEAELGGSQGPPRPSPSRRRSSRTSFPVEDSSAGLRLRPARGNDDLVAPPRS
jgi:DNA-binding HxlR family transcriptional regulator